MKAPLSDAMRDIAVMEESLKNLPEVIYAKAFCQKRFDDAFERVDCDFEKAASLCRILASDDAMFVDLLRSFVDK